MSHHLVIQRTGGMASQEPMKQLLKRATSTMSITLEIGTSPRRFVHVVMALHLNPRGIILADTSNINLCATESDGRIQHGSISLKSSCSSIWFYYLAYRVGSHLRGGRT